MTWRPALLTALLLLAVTQATTAQTQPDPAVEADKLFHRVMSPYCPGRVLATCGSGAADTLRQEVRQELAAGKPAAEIEAELYRRFGDSIRGEPKTTGMGLLAWVLPAAVFALTGAWLVTWLRRARRPETGNPASAPAASPQMLARLDDELIDLN